jgi:hypothetical protein
VRSPGRPELGQDRPSVAGDERIEGAVGEGLRSEVEGRQGGVALAAAANFHLLVEGDAVGGAAVAAGDGEGGHGSLLGSIAQSVYLTARAEATLDSRRTDPPCPAEAAK